MKAKDYSIMHCKDGNLYINRNLWTEFRSDDSKRFSEEDLKSIETWIKQNNEYVRKDAFIEKACEWIKSMWSETDNRFKEDYTGMLIDNFKNYIKGE